MQTYCGTFYEDLSVLHDRMDALKKLTAQNDHLLDTFVVDQISKLDSEKKKVDEFAETSIERMTKNKITASELNLFYLTH